MLLYTKTTMGAAALAAAALVTAACDPAGEEPVMVTLPVVASGTGIDPCTNDMGWTVQVDALRLAIADLEFTIEGEAHAGLLDRILEWAVPSALAHPGHDSGGEVTGELPGRFLLDFTAGANQPLGMGSLLAEQYHGMNFTFTRATLDDGVLADDPLLGHTAHLAGLASKTGVEIGFSAQIDVTDGKQMVGAPFDLAVHEETTATLAVRLLSNDPSELGDTLFDGLDFGALDPDGDGQVSLIPFDPGHNILMKLIEVHDHYYVDVL